MSNKKLGYAIRAERQRLYKRPSDFLAALEEWTGCQINEHALFRYERGQTRIPLDVFVCIMVTFYGGSWRDQTIIFLQYVYSDILTGDA